MSHHENNDKQHKQETKDGDILSPSSRRFSIKEFVLGKKGSKPGGILFMFAVVTAIMMAIPVLYVIGMSLFAGADRWISLLDSRIPRLIWNTLSLTVSVTFAAVVIGVALAWLVNRTSLPGRKMWQWLLALPLVIPPYVGAVTYIIVFGPRGWVAREWESHDWLVNLIGEYSFNIYSFTGIFLVLTLFTYPYVFLIASASIRKMNRNFEEVARSQGLSTWQVFWKVNLPFLRPAIGAGAILIALYVLSDFGAIAMMRYTTFTAAIYYQMGSYDNVSATVLSVVLIGLTLIILWIEAKSKKKQSYHQSSNSFKETDNLPLGKWKWFATLFVWFIFIISVVLPIGVLIYWSVLGIQEGALNANFWMYAWNSIKVSGLAAIICMIMALPVVYLRSRYPSRVSYFIEKISYAGYALPGVIVALGIIFIFNNHIPVLYNTYYLIAFAFVIRFLPQAMQSTDASLSLLSPRMDEAARSLGHPPWKVLIKVIIPSILPGILAGGALVFVSSIKELPATLLLRPPGFDTLAVRIWVEASEAIYHMAAPAALLIVIVSIIPLRYLLKKY
ncbi:iron transporter [Alkalihalobacillus alcalophilus ATCC 27647 = CGMCC 1.3604]|uniref:Iron transporter n=1 Tax=Alkalihalobacillus alcalophilus ATCC 27647 = CGMCC 1.3604 TaxID=1218173 RepID=J8T7M4_ALKAL|nr:iron ABC transporter permease [Alkalihalobacillus alcalophilus]AFV25897.1 iron(III) transporter [Alkalihalobacillus alcalophilus ATCC 27647 = CGMCC 1.3604]KGA98410.1 iron transporter [Alkalihalobacillus alcalophilus ATCC 27647 = CGMCC 1.3604]MED1563947.1 iron ABC transporter permease [Alkalihalobacillus alcalophilus]THG91567.1 iron transporter [Alkalihalobacillus alcalophilus ATCC 27647 = CGMCC 1.3604]